MPNETLPPLRLSYHKRFSPFGTPVAASFTHLLDTVLKFEMIRARMRKEMKSNRAPVPGTRTSTLCTCYMLGFRLHVVASSSLQNERERLAFF